MKHIFALSLLLTFVSLTALANPVDLKSAQEVGSKFLNANTLMKTDDASALQWVTTYRTDDGTAAFYVFNHTNGFVIVAADDCAIPILGYSDEGPFDPEQLPIQMEDYLQRFVEEIQYGITNHLQGDEETARQWALVKATGHIMAERATTVVEPLVTALWGQGCYYNDLCPSDYQGNCGHALVGCVAVAMGQIMHYWGYPSQGSGSHSYTPISTETYLPSGYPDQYANFGATTYQWYDMPNMLSATSSSAQVNAVATLLWHCGVSVEMMYGVNASGAYSIDVPDALINHFSYASDMQYITRSGYLQDGWLNQIKASLDMGRPVYYSGTDTQGQGGHAFVCDGYDANNMLHMNWGWYGNQNNYFADGALNVSVYQFNNNVAAIVNIHPFSSGLNYVVQVSADPSYGGVVTGSGIYGAYEMCTVTATANDNYMFEYWTKDGNVVSTSESYTFVVKNDTDLKAHFISSSYNHVEATYYPDPEDSQGPSTMVTWSLLPPTPLSGDITADFEDGTLGDWTTIDADGDGRTWYTWTTTEGPAGHSGSSYTATSASYDGMALFPDNYLVSPLVELGGTLHFWACAQSTYFPSEHFGVALSIVDNTNPNAFITIQAWTISAKDTGGTSRETNDGSRAQGNWYEYTVDLSNYGGALGYVAIRHFDCCDNFRLNVDDIELTVPNGAKVASTRDYVFDVYRTTADNEGPYTDENTTLLAQNLTSSPYIDLGWEDLEEGSYKYGVSMKDEEGEVLVTAWSNPLLKGQRFLITALANPGQGGTIAGAGYYASGLTCTLVATPHETYDFVNWTKDGVVVSDSPAYSFVVTENAEYQAHFELRMHTVTTSTDPAGAGNVSPGGTYVHGTTCTLESSSNPGYAFQYWSINGAQVSSQHSYSFTVTEDAVCVAHYSQLPSYTITVSASPSDGGVVTGGGTYYINQTCSLSATANTGYQFDHWTKNGSVTSNGPSFSFTVNQNATYVAHFTLKSYQVSAYVNPSGSGVISGAGTYVHGSTATLSVTPNENYHFIKWTENGTEVATTPTYSFVVTGNHQLIAHLEYIDAVDEQQPVKVMLYPNPVNEKLTVESEEPVRQYEVYSMSGALVAKVKEGLGQRLDLDVEGLPAGTYLLRLTTDSAVLTRKFVKQ